MVVQFPNLVDDFTVGNPKWNHLDFLWAIDVDLYLFPRILENIVNAEENYRLTI